MLDQRDCRSAVSVDAVVLLLASDYGAPAAPALERVSGDAGAALTEIREPTISPRSSFSSEAHQNRNRCWSSGLSLDPVALGPSKMRIDALVIGVDALLATVSRVAGAG